MKSQTPAKRSPSFTWDISRLLESKFPHYCELIDAVEGDRAGGKTANFQKRTTRHDSDPQKIELLRSLFKAKALQMSIPAIILS